jgi:hypothetical protein
MSLQLTLARAEERAAEAAWNDHRRHCPLCERATRSRKPGELCTAGARQREALARARAAVKTEQILDKAPIAGQETLF